MNEKLKKDKAVEKIFEIGTAKYVIISNKPEPVKKTKKILTFTDFTKKNKDNYIKLTKTQFKQMQAMGLFDVKMRVIYEKEMH